MAQSIDQIDLCNVLNLKFKWAWAYVVAVVVVVGGKYWSEMRAPSPRSKKQLLKSDHAD